MKQLSLVTLAQVADFDLSSASHVLPAIGDVNSARYAAPERMQPGALFSTPADVFSFGVLLWEIITFGAVHRLILY